jgi:hypothetical protein
VQSTLRPEDLDGYNHPTPLAVELTSAAPVFLRADFGYVAQICLVNPNDPRAGARVTYEYVTFNGVPAVRIRVTLDTDYADMAYGPGSKTTGWPGNGRSFAQIVNSDHVAMTVYDGSGAKVLEFAIDLFAELDRSGTGIFLSAGIESTGYHQTDGAFLYGNRAWVLDTETSMNYNWNVLNPPWRDTNTSPTVTYPGYTNSGHPGYEWETWYEATIDLAAFGGLSGFDPQQLSKLVTGLHSSPSKTGAETPPVEECPPDYFEIVEQMDSSVERSLPSAGDVTEYDTGEKPTVDSEDGTESDGGTPDQPDGGTPDQPDGGTPNQPDGGTPNTGESGADPNGADSLVTGDAGNGTGDLPATGGSTAPDTESGVAPTQPTNVILLYIPLADK